MAVFKPFRGFRPPPAIAGKVASRPYDVLNSEEARAEAAGNPLSFLHVGKPEIDLPPETGLYDPIVYNTGKANLEKMVAEKTLLQDPRPAYYLYAQTMGGHTQTGIVGCASVSEYLDNTIRKHEFTRKDKEDDRTRHVDITNAHSGPIFLTYRAVPVLDAIVKRVCASPAPTDFTAADGIRHQLWVVDDESTVTAIRSAFAGIRNLYIADGHHRAAAAGRVGHERAARNPGHTGNEEYYAFLSVCFPDNQLRIMDYNRTVKDLNGRTPEAFLEEIRNVVSVNPAGSQVKPAEKGTMGMFMGGKWYRLGINQRFLATSDPVERLDVAILQKQLLAPVLGIDDPRTNKRIDFVGGIRGLGELERRVNSGEMAVAFAMYPTSIAELLAIADAGQVMPPKSTWFEPKLRDGMVVHFLA